MSSREISLPFTVRALTAADVPAFVALRREALRDSPWAFAASEESDVGVNAELMTQRIVEPGQAIVGAFEGERLIGIAGMVRNRHGKMAHRAAVWGVYVTPSARGRGVAEGIIRELLAIARTLPGLDSVSLQVSARAEGARRVYERLGFRRWGVEPAALRLDGVAYDETHMVIEL
jgi:RimJ/RimL family protein N-acetyltransferase